MFLRPEAILHDVGDEVVGQIDGIDTDTDEAGDKNTGEYDTDDALIETVISRVHEREDLEEGIVDPVHERGVQIHKRDGGIFDRDLHGLDQRVDSHTTGFQAGLVDLALTLESMIARECAQPLGASEQDIRTRCLGHEQEHQYKHRSGNPEDLPKRPPPSFRHDRESRQQWTERGTAVCG